MAVDPHDLNRFLLAQEDEYDFALAEIRSGRKHTHWMWFVFPQFEGLGFSSTAQLYSIKSVAEARAYLDHPVLGPRLRECAEAALTHKDKSAYEIFGSPDDVKLRSSATLFALISPSGSAFHRILGAFFAGQMDLKTLELTGLHPAPR